MRITFLGHAGFCVETERAVLLMDPWLSPHGGFDASWFQYPRNHHLFDQVQLLFETTEKEKYIYISHEHEDHFDQWFLNQLNNRDFKLILADFVNPVIKPKLLAEKYQCKEIVCLKNDETLLLPDATVVLFTIDAELECDSAILVKTESCNFLNLNDCKLHGVLPSIVEEHGKIDVFSAQFSGAIWHPTCYTYPDKYYAKVSEEKKRVKFLLTSNAISFLQPSFYLPASGPPCFLDPMLIEKNFEKVNIFPRAQEMIAYLDTHCDAPKTKWPEVLPGDVLDTDTMMIAQTPMPRINDEHFEHYVRDYAKDYQDFFKQRAMENAKVNALSVFAELGKELQKKISLVDYINHDVSTILYWKLNELDEMYCVNFQEKTIGSTNAVDQSLPYVLIETPAWQVNKVLTGIIDWPIFALTFRVAITRRPDVYNSLIHGFITINAESINRFCELVSAFRSNVEKIEVTVNGRHYKIRRYCPHQGADLTHACFDGKYLVCPRHRWKFDIENGGKCIYNDETLDAVPIDSLDS